MKELGLPGPVEGCLVMLALQLLWPSALRQPAGRKPNHTHIKCGQMQQALGYGHNTCIPQGWVHEWNH